MIVHCGDTCIRRGADLGILIMYLLLGIMYNIR